MVELDLQRDGCKVGVWWREVAVNYIVCVTTVIVLRSVEKQIEMVKFPQVALSPGTSYRFHEKQDVSRGQRGFWTQVLLMLGAICSV